MFSRLSDALHQALNNLASSSTYKDDFIYHWLGVTNYFLNHKGIKIPIDETGIPGHLDEMVKLLVAEECDQGAEDTGPCLEYLLHHKLLDTLYTLGRTDFPPGMKQLVLIFFTKLLTRIVQPILPHIGVHRAVNRLINICGEIKAGPTETEEVYFLCTVCSKLKIHPDLTNFFLQSNGSGDQSLPDKNGGCGLINALVVLSRSEDAKVSVKACEGLMLLTSLPGDSAAQCVIDSTFCSEISNRFCQLYERLPCRITPLNLETVRPTWGLDILRERSDVSYFEGERNVTSFFSWLDYCDQMISAANGLVASTLASSILDNFLVSSVKPSLLEISEADLIVTLTYVTHCVKSIFSVSLLSAFVNFLLDERVNSDKSQYSLKQKLIESCNHVSDQISIAHIRLFDVLLMKNDRNILTRLVLQDICEDVAMNKNSPISQCTDVSDISSSDNLTSGGTSHTSSLPQCTDVHDVISSEDLTSVVATHCSPLQTPFIIPADSMNKDRYERKIHWLLNLLPLEIKSSDLSVECNYDTYVNDARNQYSQLMDMCQSWNWPKSPMEPRVYSVNSSKTSFLKMILERLSRLLSQSYEMNLHVTSIFSTLALFPRADLQEILLFSTVTHNCDKIYNPSAILKKISDEVKSHNECDSQLPMKLIRVRKLLLTGQTTFRHPLSSLPKRTRTEETSLLEGIVLFEEFCKELAAITCVKMDYLTGLQSLS